MKFTKMHGIGNDYVYVNMFEETIEDPSALARIVSDRHFGIGGDGLILVCPSEVADFRMDMYNADGSRGEMCGNGIRCVAKFVYDHHLTDQTTITIETLAGIKTLILTVEEGKATKIRVDMGEPILAPKDVPVISDLDQVVNEAFIVDGREVKMTCISMGNPHAVTYVDDVHALDLEAIGPAFENFEKFPNRINTEFIHVISRSEQDFRVWERGSGETLACGTGACASVVSSVLNGLTDRKVTVHLLGGDLEIEWNENDNHVYMTGSATTVFEGVLTEYIDENGVVQHV